MGPVDRPFRRLTREDLALTGDPELLKGLRLLLVDDRPHRSLALAEDLEDLGVAVAVTDGHGAGLAAAREHDPDAVILDAEVFANPASQVLERLRRDRRLRWAPLVVVPWGELDAVVSPLELLAGALFEISDYEREIRRRAAEDDRFEASLERTGPGRLLRLLADVGAPRRVAVEAPSLAVEIDVAQGLVVSAAARVPGEPTVEGLQALRMLLDLTMGRALVSRLPSAPAANVALPLDEALARASGATPLATPRAQPSGRHDGDRARPAAPFPLLGDRGEPSRSGVVPLRPGTGPAVGGPTGSAADLAPGSAEVSSGPTTGGGTLRFPPGPLPSDSEAPDDPADVTPVASLQPLVPPRGSRRDSRESEPDFGAGVLVALGTPLPEPSGAETRSSGPPAATRSTRAVGATGTTTLVGVPDPAPDPPQPPGAAQALPSSPRPPARPEGATSSRSEAPPRLPTAGPSSAPAAAAAASISPPQSPPSSPAPPRRLPSLTAEDAAGTKALAGPDDDEQDAVVLPIQGWSASPRLVAGGLAALAFVGVILAVPMLFERRAPGPGRTEGTAPTSTARDDVSAKVGRDPSVGTGASGGNQPAPPSSAVASTAGRDPDPAPPSAPSSVMAPAEDSAPEEVPGAPRRAAAPDPADSSPRDGRTSASSRTLVFRGELAISDGEFDEARRLFEEALAADPDANRAMAGMARLALITGRYDDATTWVDRALEWRPRRIDYHLLRGDVLAARGDAAAAKRAWRQGLLLAPGDRRLLRRLRPDRFDGTDDGIPGDDAAAAATPSTGELPGSGTTAPPAEPSAAASEPPAEPPATTSSTGDEGIDEDQDRTSEQGY